MLESPLQGPLEEQAICVNCGFCCDGTLFFHAMLQPGEKGSLPEMIEKKYRMENGKEFFILPCLYFNKKCTIYGQKRAQVCSGYRCQMLKDFAEGRMTVDGAMGTVRETMKMRTEVMEQYRMISSSVEGINYRQLLLELGKIMKSASADEPLNMDIEMLIAKCNIYEALLIKHFRSAGDFDKMICSNEMKKE